MDHPDVRAARESDLAAALALIHAALAENPWLIRIPELVEDAIHGTSGEYFACVAEQHDKCVGLGAYGLVAGTVGTWTLYALVTASQSQDAGYGRAIVAHITDDLASRGARIVVADVPGHDALRTYRSFLKSQGFTEESRVEDYYADGIPLVQYRLDLK